MVFLRGLCGSASNPKKIRTTVGPNIVFWVKVMHTETVTFVKENANKLNVNEPLLVTQTGKSG